MGAADVISPLTLLPNFFRHQKRIEIYKQTTTEEQQETI
jgi:hypothetical protein